MKGKVTKIEDSGEAYEGHTMFYCEINDGTTTKKGVTYQKWNVGQEVEFEEKPNKRHGITFKKPQQQNNFNAKSYGGRDENAMDRRTALITACDMCKPNGSSAEEVILYATKLAAWLKEKPAETTKNEKVENPIGQVKPHDNYPPQTPNVTGFKQQPLI